MRYAPPPIEIRANRTLEDSPEDERASTPRLSCVPAGGGIYSGLDREFDAVHRSGLYGMA